VNVSDVIKVQLHQMGYGAGTALTVLTDGEETLRDLCRVATASPITPILDWFHIAMRLQHVEQTAKGLSTRLPSLRAAATAIQSDLERLHWRLWHGRSHAVQASIERLIPFIHVFNRHVRRIPRITEAPRKLWTMLLDLDSYVRNNAAIIVDYASRHRKGLRVSSSVAESTVNHLVNRRMNKQQQMRWSPDGANRLLQVRSAVLNGEFDRMLAQPTTSVPTPDDSQNSTVAMALAG